MWSWLKAIPSVWYVGKFSFSLEVCCQSVARVTLLNASARTVSVVRLLALSIVWAVATAAPARVPATAAVSAKTWVRMRFMGTSRDWWAPVAGRRYVGGVNARGWSAR